MGERYMKYLLVVAGRVCWGKGGQGDYGGVVGVRDNYSSWLGGCFGAGRVCWV